MDTSRCVPTWLACISGSGEIFEFLNIYGLTMLAATCKKLRSSTHAWESAQIADFNAYVLEGFMENQPVLEFNLPRSPSDPTDSGSPESFIPNTWDFR